MESAKKYEIPKPQKWLGDDTLWAVTSGGQIDATFWDESDALAYAGYLEGVHKTFGGPLTRYRALRVPKPSKLGLSLSTAEKADE